MQMEAVKAAAVTAAIITSLVATAVTQIAVLSTVFNVMWWNMNAGKEASQ